MARKGKNKKINRKKFKNKVCRNCKLCTKNFSPVFCFDKFYKQNPKKFINVIPKKFKKYKNTLRMILKSDKKRFNNPLYIFKKIFCDSNICNGCIKSTPKIIQCIDIFKSQLDMQNTIKKGPIVAILCSDDKIFKEKIRLIIENNNRQ